MAPGLKSGITSPRELQPDIIAATSEPYLST